MKRLWLFLLVLLSAAPSMVWAASSPWQQDQDVAVRLVSQSEATGDEKELVFGLEVHLVQGGHTYWRSPGVAGLPPVLDWKGSENLDKVTLLYPAPVRFGMEPLDSIGYHGRVTYPLRVSLQEAGKPVSLKARLDLLICTDICLPKNFDLALALPSGAARRGSEAAILDAALAQVPQKAEDSTLHITEASVKGDTLILRIESDSKLAAPDMFIENDGDMVFKKPVISIDLDGKSADVKARLETPLKKGKSIDMAAITVTLVDGDRALAQNLSNIGATAEILPLWAILLLALLGGFILNFMPCVLPVLSLKIFGLIKHGRKGKRVIRRAFFATATGIVFSFLLLAAATVALKASGQAFGWGVQFQQPAFLVFMILVLTFFAANLWGFYEFGLPRFIQSMVDPKRHPKLTSDFASGAMATLLATPCSAPFLGTAISFALAAGWIEIFSVFGALGLGMALPYLLIAARPRIASFLPSAGSWMQVLSHVLGFGLAGTAVWLLFILGAQIGGTGAGLIALGMIGILGLLALRHRGVSRLVFYPVFLLILGGVFALTFVASTPEHLTAKSGLWKSFDEEILARNVREGKIVFVDVTADWCLTCKVNKRFALADKKVSDKLFHTDGLVAMQADWTSPDPVITEFLHKHGRFGVPFNIIFSPAMPNGHVLPELLTPSIVLNAITKAEGKKKSCPIDLPDGVGC